MQKLFNLIQVSFVWLIICSFIIVEAQEYNGLVGEWVVSKNDNKFTNFRFESNVFLDNSKIFYNKFGIYNKEKTASNLFISGNFDLSNLKLYLSEISRENKFTDEDVTLTANATNNNVGVLSNDTDVENDTLTATLVSTTSYGSLTFNLDGTFQYTPNANYFGNDGFTYKASDKVLKTDTINVNITVNSVNDVPVSNDKSATTAEDIAKDITLSATDADGDALTYNVVSEPANGSITISGSTATYTPNANYNGSDNFTYKANDGNDDSNTSDVESIFTAVFSWF